MSKNFIEIEPKLIVRGSVFKSEQKALCNCAHNKFLRPFHCNVLSTADIYGGKIFAVLDQ
jgi:hypothetical protein